MSDERATVMRRVWLPMTVLCVAILLLGVFPAGYRGADLIWHSAFVLAMLTASRSFNAAH